MQELKLHFRTDPEDEYDDIENSEYDAISIPKTKPYNDDEYDY
jgi:hypothetical protein